MFLSEARVTTGTPRRYLGQLCKHFEHKLPVTLDDQTGSIKFDAGDCDLRAEGETLVMRCSARDSTGLDRVQDVVSRHLVRFAFRSPPIIEWVPVPPAA